MHCTALLLEAMSEVSESVVLQALQAACSQDPSVLKLGEKQLNAWKNEKGYYGTLANVFVNHSLEPGVRWMALTCVKNGVDQHWRVAAKTVISDEEKALIKHALLQCMEERVPQVATQVAVLSARIARIECPVHWPELLPVLSEGVRSQSEFTRKCYLNTLKHVIKALAARRLGEQRKVFYEITVNLFVYVMKLWNTHLEGGMGQLRSGEVETAVTTLELARVCLKILYKFIVHGFPKVHAITEALQFIGSVIEGVEVLTHTWSQLPSDHAAVDVIEKTIHLKMKILLGVQSHQSLGYAAFVLPSLQLTYRLLFAPEATTQLFERFLISLLNLFRYIIVCEDYNPPRATLTESVLPPGVMEAHQAKLTFFKSAMCHQVLEKLVGSYLILSPEEMEMFETSPEEFVKEKTGNTNETSSRACVESALCAFVHSFQQTVAPLLLSMIQAVQSHDASADISTLRLKEAVYRAAGLCPFDLYDEVDFDLWYQTQLLAELRIQDPRYHFVRHRVVWLLGTWVTVKMSPELRPSLYAALVPLMAQTEHLTVRLAATEAIRISVDDFDFNTADFSQYLSDGTTLMFQLLLQVQEPDIKMKVLNVLSLLMERMGAAIQPHVAALLQYMPQLWAESADQNSSLLRCVILNTLNNIIKGLGSISSELHGFVLPVIQLATDVKNKEHIYLAEDGLELCLASFPDLPEACVRLRKVWERGYMELAMLAGYTHIIFSLRLSTIYHASSPTPDLLHLLLNMAGLLGINPPSDDSSTSMVGLMDIGSDSLELCFKIMDSYIILCTSQPEQFAMTCAEVIIRGCQFYLCDVKPEGVVAIVRTITWLVKGFPNHFPQFIENLLPTVLRKLIQEEDYPPTTAAFLTLVSRVLIQNPIYFFSLLERTAPQWPMTPTELFGHLLDTWGERLDSISNIQCRKLTGLAIANLLPLTDVCVTSRFDTLVNMCVEVLHDVMDATDNDVLFDSLVSPAADSREQSSSVSGTPSPETEHDKREQQLAQFDPVRVVNLHKHITSKLQECMGVHGSHGYVALMTGVDIIVRQQLAEFIVPQELAKTLLAFDLDQFQPS